jgi:predicted transcriptional regulator
MENLKVNKLHFAIYLYIEKNPDCCVRDISNFLEKDIATIYKHLYYLKINNIIIEDGERPKRYSTI